MKNLLKREVSKQFFRFALIGLESTVLNYLVFLVLFHYVGVFYVLASALGFISGTLLGFIFNKLYTFESRANSLVKLPFYFMVYTFSLIFTIVFISFLVEILRINPLVSNLIVMFITTLINFFGTKILVFKNKKW